jgi:Tfp pilus assembly protein PilF
MSHKELEELLSKGWHFFQQRNFSQAARAFEQATRVSPISVAAWTNLAAAHIELKQPKPALIAANRAIALKPDFAAAHVNRGDALRLQGKDVDGWLDAYQRSARLQPNSPDILNKLGATLHAVNKVDEAIRTLRRAIELMPQHHEARVNLCAALAAKGLFDKVGRTLQQGLLLRPGSQSNMDDYTAALAILAENDRLEPALAAAITNRDPDQLIRSTRAMPDSITECDATLSACLRRCISRSDPGETAHSRLGSKDQDLHRMLEAHYSAHLGETAESVLPTIDFLQEFAALSFDQLPVGTSAGLQDAHCYYTALGDYDIHRQSGYSATSDCTGWLRYWHRWLTRHRAESTPGKFKFLVNYVIVNPRVKRTHPAQVVPTLELVFEQFYETLPAGPYRAALIYYALADIHPFPDGNGRLGRFLMNRELEAAGLEPIVFAKSMKAAHGKALFSIRDEGNLQPFAEWLEQCNEYTDDMYRQVYELQTTGT